jgi:DNA polymerase-3 subunit delta
MKTSTSSPSSNVYIFHGEDDFSIKRKIDFWREEFAKKYSSSGIVFFDGEKLDEMELMKKLEESLAPSLFSSKKFIIAKNVLPSKASQESLAEALSNIIGKIPNDYFLVFWQTEKLDQRLKVIKRILSLNIKVTEFKLPIGKEFTSWLFTEAKKLGVEFEPSALEKLAQYLGRDLVEERKSPQYDLWQAQSELEKLASFSKQIKSEHIEGLIKPKLPDNVFALSDSIINKQERQAFTILEQLLTQSGSDEKSSVIKIVGLLAEQLKALVSVSLLSKQKKSQEEMAEILGWTSGRVYINLKLAKNLDMSKAKELLALLLKIDKSLKSSDADPKLLINMFIHQASA